MSCFSSITLFSRFFCCQLHLESSSTPKLTYSLLYCSQIRVLHLACLAQLGLELSQTHQYNYLLSQLKIATVKSASLIFQIQCLSFYLYHQNHIQKHEHFISKFSSNLMVRICLFIYFFITVYIILSKLMSGFINKTVTKAEWKR